MVFQIGMGDNLSPSDSPLGWPKDDDDDDVQSVNKLRVLAYLMRVKAIAVKTRGAMSIMKHKAVVTAMKSIHFKTGFMRYFAFTSDFGEAFRPAVPAWLVNFSYGVSVAYIGGSIAEVGYMAYDMGNPMGFVGGAMMQEACFQFLASLAIPFLLIHTTVHRTTSALFKRKVHLSHPQVAKWLPSACGLSVIPVLPLAVDKPVEHFVEHCFETWVWDDRHLARQSSKLHVSAGGRQVSGMITSKSRALSSFYFSE